MEKMAALSTLFNVLQVQLFVEKTVRNIFRTRKPVIMQKTCHYLNDVDSVPKP